MHHLKESYSALLCGLVYDAVQAGFNFDVVDEILN